MPLTTQIKHGGPVRDWLREHFPPKLVQQKLKEVNGQLRARSPLVTPGVESGAVSGLVGTAFDYRLRYLLRYTPAQELAAWRALPNLYGVEGGAETLDAFVAYLDQHTQAADDPDNRELCRACGVLAYFEQIYRSGLHPNSPIAGLLDEPVITLEHLLATVPEPAVMDVQRLFATALDDFASLRSRPLTLNPDFAGSRAVGGADADLIIDRELIEIKTTRRPLGSADLYQLIGYTVLDYDDLHQLEAVGLYLPRYQYRRTWNLAELIAELSPLPLSELRERFRAAFPTPRREDLLRGGDPPSA